MTTTNMNRRGAVAAALLFLTLTVSANPIYFVDTGPGNNISGGYALYNTTPVNGDFQFLAVSFSLETQATITDIQGWIWHPNAQASHINFIIYGDGGSVPDVTTELFNQVATVPSHSAPQWRGLTGLNWNLPGGEYWLAFEVRQPELPDNAMPWGAPNGQPGAYYNGGNEALGYLPGVAGIGFRIQGFEVPEPASLSILVASVGLMARGHYVMKRSKRANIRRGF